MPATIERVKSHVIDTLGCGIAADERPVRVCREIAQSVQGAATIIGTTRMTSPDLAAFAKGAAGRYYGFGRVISCRRYAWCSTGDDFRQAVQRAVLLGAICTGWRLALRCFSPSTAEGLGLAATW